MNKKTMDKKSGPKRAASKLVGSHCRVLCIVGFSGNNNPQSVFSFLRFYLEPVICYDVHTIFFPVRLTILYME